MWTSSLAALFLIVLGLIDDTALSTSLVAGTQARIAGERRLPPETAGHVVVRGEVAGDAYQGVESISFVLTNATDWYISEITVELSTSASGPPAATAYVLRTTNAVKPGGTARLSARLDDAVSDRSGFRWRYLGARGFPSKP